MLDEFVTASRGARRVAEGAGLGRAGKPLRQLPPGSSCRVRAAWAAGVLAGLALVAGAATAADDAGAIEAAAAEWIAAFKAGDIDALMALYMPDAFVALHGQPAMRGKQAIRAYFAPKMGTAEVEFLLEFEDIEVHGDVAHLVSRYWYTATPVNGGEPYRDAGRSALVYKRDVDGRWKIYLDIDQATPDVVFPVPETLTR
jgi:uncharacterized protein (TIGR02246 family)